MLLAFPTIKQEDCHQYLMAWIFFELITCMHYCNYMYKVTVKSSMSELSNSINCVRRESWANIVAHTITILLFKTSIWEEYARYSRGKDMQSNTLGILCK